MWANCANTARFPLNSKWTLLLRAEDKDDEEHSFSLWLHTQMFVGEVDKLMDANDYNRA